MGMRGGKGNVAAQLFSELSAILFTEVQKIESHHCNAVASVVKIQRPAVKRVVYSFVRTGAMGIARHLHTLFG